MWISDHGAVMDCIDLLARVFTKFLESSRQCNLMSIGSWGCTYVSRYETVCPRSRIPRRSDLAENALHEQP